METLDSVCLAVQKDDWAILLELKDAQELPCTHLSQVKEISSFPFHGDNIPF